MILRKGPVVHIDGSGPNLLSAIDARDVAVKEMSVQHRGDEVVGRGDRREVSGEEKVDVLHRQHLAVSAPACAAFHPENGSQSGLTGCRDGRYASLCECLRKTDRGGGLSFSVGSRRGGSDKNELALGPALEPLNPFPGELALESSKRLEIVVTELRGRGDLADRAQSGFLGDLEIRHDSAFYVTCSAGIKPGGFPPSRGCVSKRGDADRRPLSLRLIALVLTGCFCLDHDRLLGCRKLLDLLREINPERGFDLLVDG